MGANARRSAASSNNSSWIHTPALVKQRSARSIPTSFRVYQSHHRTATDRRRGREDRQERQSQTRQFPSRLRTHPPGHKHRAVLPARSQAPFAQQLDGPQQRQNRVRNQLHQILLQIQTPAQRRRNHQRLAGAGEGE